MRNFTMMRDEGHWNGLGLWLPNDWILLASHKSVQLSIRVGDNISIDSIMNFLEPTKASKLHIFDRSKTSCWVIYDEFFSKIVNRVFCSELDHIQIPMGANCSSTPTLDFWYHSEEPHRTKWTVSEINFSYDLFAFARDCDTRRKFSASIKP